MGYFSQNDEERVILERLPEADGFFVDIGAASGKTLSNTHALALRGWSGVCVEPAPHMFRALIDEYFDNPRITLVNAAVVARYQMDAGLLRFQACNDYLSSSNPAHVEKCKASHGVYRFREMWVAQIALSGLFQQFVPHDRRVGLLSIDVEGDSVNLLTSLMFNRDDTAAPKLIVVERDDRDRDIRAWADNNGYREIHLTHENFILERVQ